MTIRRAEMVWILGSRRAVCLLERAAVLLRQQARPHVLAASLDLAPTGRDHADEVVFAIAIGADTDELEELPDIVSRRRCQLVVLGDFAQSSLLQSANCPVLLPRTGSDTHDMIVTLTILDAILGDLPGFQRTQAAEQL
jgi:DNA-binding MurR/RpiR family transcriptional regulator